MAESFNKKHPELKPGEVFLGNFTKVYFKTSIGWLTKRMGERAYAREGEIIKSVIKSLKLYPVFVSREEIIKKGRDPEKF